MISTVTLNPAVDKTIHITKLVPNDTNRITKVEMDAGGKGINCSRMVVELGAETKAVAFLGGRTGDFIHTVLERERVSVDSVTVSKETRTSIGVEEETINRPPTTFNEPGGPIDHRELVEMFEKVKNVARESSYMLFGGSVPLGINDDIYNVLIQIATSAGAKAALDTDGTPLIEGLKAKPFMIKPNLSETERFLRKEFTSRSDVARAALQFAEMGIELVVISLGKQGAVACYQDFIYDVIPPEVKAISTIGSGDSMIAGILASLERKESIEDALRLGSAAGAATAMSDGTDIGRKNDIDQLVSKVKVTRLEPSKP